MTMMSLVPNDTGGFRTDPVFLALSDEYAKRGANPNTMAASPTGTGILYNDTLSNDLFDPNGYLGTGPAPGVSQTGVGALYNDTAFNNLLGLGSATPTAEPTFLDKLFGNLGLLGNLASGIGGAAALNSAYDRLGAIGQAAQAGALGLGQQALDQTRFQPFTVTSATGASTATTPEGSLTLTPSQVEQALQDQLFGGASQMYGAAIQPTAQREQDIYNRMLTAMQPEMQRQRLANEERMAAQGRLGVSSNMYGGMAPENFQLNYAQQEAMNNAYLGAMQQAQREQLQQAQIGQGMLAGAYVPQSNLLNALQQGALLSEIAQRGQLQGANLFGEAGMGGLEALLASGLGQANLMGQLGTSILGGLATPTDTYGGLGEILGGVFGSGGLFDIQDIFGGP